MKRFIPVLVFFLLATCAANAQSLTGKIFGKISDPTGASLPGVKVTISSPAALQPFEATTSADGAYTFPNLPIGTYEAKFEVMGYRTSVRQGIVLDSGFNAEIDIALNVATVQQSIDVQSDAPVVDTQSTALATHLDEQRLQELPTGRDQMTLVALTPSALGASKDTGGNTNGTTTLYFVRGGDPNQTRYIMDGADLSTPGAAQAMWMDYDSFKEVQIALGGSDASQQSSGIQVNMISKSGGNKVHGSVHFAFEDQHLEATNLSQGQRNQAILSGASSGNPLQRFSDWGAEAGGPIKKDKLWYWADYTRQTITLGADKVFNTTSDCNPVAAAPLKYDARTVRSCTLSTPATLQHVAYKITWSPFHNNTFNFMNRYDVKNQSTFGFTPLRPLESTQILASQYAPELGYSFGKRFWDAGWPNLWKFDDQQIVNDRLVLHASFMHFDKPNQQLLHSQSELNIMPAFEQSTSQFSRSYFYTIANQPMNGAEATATYFVPAFLGGSHTFTFGYKYQHFENLEIQNYGGAGQAIFNSGTAAPFTTALAVNFYQPSKIDAFLVQSSAYIQDSYKYKRLNLNLGVRYDRQRDSEGAMQVAASPYEGQVTRTGAIFNFLPAQNYLGGTSLPWNTFAPRLGANYDVTGSGKTVVKASYDVYYDQRFAGQFSDIHNFTGAATAGQGTVPNFVQFPWTDLNGDGIVQLNEVNTTTIRAFGGNFNPNNPNQTTTPNSVDPNIKDPMTQEVTVGFSREVVKDAALQINYIYRHYSDFVWKQLNGITSANYSPQTFTPPANTCLSGATCPTVTYFVPNIPVPAAYTYANQPNYTRAYKGLEVLFAKRMSHRWQLNGSFTYQSVTQHFGNGSYIDPTNIAIQNDQQYTLPSTTTSAVSLPIVVSARWIARASGVYQLPWWGIKFSGVLDLHQGYPIQNTVNVASRPNSAGAIQVLTNAPGSVRFPTFEQLDLRAERTFHLTDRFRLEADIDVYNVLNSNLVMAQQPIQNSSTANYIGVVQGPAVGRGTLRLVF